LTSDSSFNVGKDAYISLKHSETLVLKRKGGRMTYQYGDRVTRL